MSDNGPLKVLLLAAEVVPFAKTGGLADVAGALPKTISALGHDIRVAMPRYGRIDPDKFKLQEVVPLFDVPIQRTTEPARILQATIGIDIPVYMVDSTKYFDREGIYMYADDADRFHQPLDPLAADMDAFIDQLGVDAWRPVGLSGGLVDRLDAGCQRRIGMGTRARRPPEPGVVAGMRHTERLAHRLDGEHGLVRRHELEDRDDIASL